MQVQVYTGSQESRAMIRKYEFHDEAAGQRAEQSKKRKNETPPPKFHALMTSYELVLQDNTTLQVRSRSAAYPLWHGHGIDPRCRSLRGRLS